MLVLGQEPVSISRGTRSGFGEDETSLLVISRRFSYVAMSTSKPCMWYLWIRWSMSCNNGVTVDCFDMVFVFFFFYFSFLAMCILDFYTFFRHYVIVEVGRIWYHIGINIFPLLKRKYFWRPWGIGATSSCLAFFRIRCKMRRRELTSRDGSDPRRPWAMPKVPLFRILCIPCYRFVCWTGKKWLKAPNRQGNTRSDCGEERQAWRSIAIRERKDTMGIA
jgi:hypothetical protein